MAPCSAAAGSTSAHVYSALLGGRRVVLGVGHQLPDLLEDGAADEAAEHAEDDPERLVEQLHLRPPALEQEEQQQERHHAAGDRPRTACGFSLACATVSSTFCWASACFSLTWAFFSSTFALAWAFTSVLAASASTVSPSSSRVSAISPRSWSASGGSWPSGCSADRPRGLLLGLASPRPARPGGVVGLLLLLAPGLGLARRSSRPCPGLLVSLIVPPFPSPRRRSACRSGSPARAPAARPARPASCPSARRCPRRRTAPRPRSARRARVHRGGQADDGGGDQRADRVEGDHARAAEEAGADTGALALLRSARAGRAGAPCAPASPSARRAACTSSPTGLLSFVCCSTCGLTVESRCGG